MAFTDTRYPGDDRLSIPNGDLEIQAFTGYVKWQDVPLEIFPRENAALNFFGSSVLSMLILTQTVYWQAIYREIGY